MTQVTSAGGTSVRSPSTAPVDDYDREVERHLARRWPARQRATDWPIQAVDMPIPRSLPGNGGEGVSCRGLPRADEVGRS